MDITTLGIDIAKNIFQIHGINTRGQVVLTQRVSRLRLLATLANIPPCLVGIEACGGAHYWARQLEVLGHTVKLMNPAFVKPYVKSNKNDQADAAAICEAVTRPTMRFVAVKTLGQQDIQAVHRIRSRLVKDRTALVNQIRGLLAEYGIVIPQGISHLRKQLVPLLESQDNELSTLAVELFTDLATQLKQLDTTVENYDQKIKRICQENSLCQKLTQLEGVGPLIATACYSAIGNASVFKSGREMAAFIGVVPKQHSSGGKERLLGISKRGDSYLRCLLIHGARAVIYRAKYLPEKKKDWINSLLQRRGVNRTTVALANKNARIMWALLTREEAYHKEGVVRK